MKYHLHAVQHHGQIQNVMLDIVNFYRGMVYPCPLPPWHVSRTAFPTRKAEEARVILTSPSRCKVTCEGNEHVIRVVDDTTYEQLKGITFESISCVSGWRAPKWWHQFVFDQKAKGSVSGWAE